MSTRRRKGGGDDHADAEASSSLSLTKPITQTAAPAPRPAEKPPSARPSLPLSTLALRHAAPAALLLAALAWHFDGLVGTASASARQQPQTLDADGTDKGVATLVRLLAVAVTVQVGAAVVGLPPAGADLDEWETLTVAERTKRRKPKKDGTRRPNVAVTTFLALVLTALATPLVHAVLVLFGAPFLSHTLRTLLCAAHLAVLGLFPVVFTRGTDDGAWRAIVAGSSVLLLSPSATAPKKTGKSSIVDAPVAGLWGAALGAWLGAVPIPLDWDRPWQQWPVSVLVGLYLGHVVGRLVGGWMARR